MRVDLNEWRTFAAKLCRKVGDMTEPAYIVGDAEATKINPTLDTRLCGATAYTGVVADLWLKEYLVGKGLWKGRGFATVVVDSELPKSQDWLGAVLHELAHHLTHSTSDRLLHLEPTLVEQVAAIELKFLENTVTLNNRRLKSVPWESHGPEFVRAACHVAHRANREIQCVRPRHLRFSEPYYGPGLNENTMMGMLEPELGSKKSIREILQTEPPKLFAEIMEMATTLP